MFCKKLIVQNVQTGSPSIFLGLITKEEGDLIYFQTAKKNYVFNKSLVLAIEETNEIYKGEKQ